MRRPSEICACQSQASLAASWVFLGASSGCRRLKLSLNATTDLTLVLELLGVEAIGGGRVSTSVMGLWERAALAKIGVIEAESERFGTHSATATLLSWAAKADLSPHHRKLLCAHADREERSMLAYARDALAGPLEKRLGKCCRRLNIADSSHTNHGLAGLSLLLFLPRSSTPNILPP